MSATADTQLARENEHLRRALDSQFRELRASRLRIAEAAVAERRRVERDLHDGAQQRLVTLALQLAMAQQRAERTTDAALAAQLSEIAAGLAEAVTELRELARGIHPSVLSEAGLGPALDALAERASVPVDVVAAPAGRFAPLVEATVYFVVSEALTNVARHARATCATVSARVGDDAILVEVDDDGVGGVRACSGTGLVGLRDRVAALAGDLDVGRRPGGGTRLRARIPCA